ncbi:MAG TPA: hypothetical protein VNX28_10980 [Gemmataceae bacterium]|jgi:hypothetical protein|nr:hypothetical protein [Gemmataceae bacterium]
MDAATAALLQEMVRKEGRSLLQYVSESVPWTTPKNHEALPVLLDLVREEQEGAAAIVKLLLKHRVRPPYLGAYPMSFTTINYMSLDFLLPYLIDFEKRRIAELEQDLTVVSDEEAKHLLRTLLEMKQRHLLTLRNLGGVEKPAA